MQILSDADYVAHFEVYIVSERRVSDNTLAAYRSDIAQLLTFLKKYNLTLPTANTKDLKKFVSHMRTKLKIKPRSLARKISSCKLLYKYLHENYGLENMATKLIFPRIEKSLPIYLTEEEIEDLFAAAERQENPRGVRNLVMLHMLYGSGMRITELVTLTLDQLHFDTGFVSVNGKGNKQRDIPLPAALFNLVRFYLDTTYSELVPPEEQSKDKPFVFPTFRAGKVAPITRQSFWQIMKKLMVSAGIKKNISPHTLRHSLATHLLKNGANIRSLQLLLGHERVTTIEIYTHLEKNQIRSEYDEKHPRAQ